MKFEVQLCWLISYIRLRPDEPAWHDHLDALVGCAADGHVARSALQSDCIHEQ
jgi:hypothetical protein